MELVNRERIGDLALEIYDVSPGGSADLLDGHSEKVSSWSESFVVEFEKPFRIGRNERGSDVFPYLTRDGFGNTALPTVAVRSMGVGVNARDLEVRCLCDGRRVSISRSYPFAGDGDGAPSSVMLQLSKSSIPLFVADGLLVVKQRSTDMGPASVSLLRRSRPLIRAPHVGDDARPRVGHLSTGDGGSRRARARRKARVQLGRKRV